MATLGWVFGGSTACWKPASEEYTLNKPLFSLAVLFCTSLTFRPKHGPRGGAHPPPLAQDAFGVPQDPHRRGCHLPRNAVELGWDEGARKKQ